MGYHLGSIYFVFFQWQKNWANSANLPNFNNQLEFWKNSNCRFSVLRWERPWGLFGLIKKILSVFSIPLWDLKDPTTCSRSCPPPLYTQHRLNDFILYNIVQQKGNNIVFIQKPSKCTIWTACKTFKDLHFAITECKQPWEEPKL